MADEIHPVTRMMLITLLRRQIELVDSHYLGTKYLSKNASLRAIIAENEGWVPIDVLVAIDTKKNDKLVWGEIPLVKDKLLFAINFFEDKVVELDETGEKIRRCLYENVVSDLTVDEARLCVHVFGFHPEATSDEISKFLTKFGVLSVHLERYLSDKAFAGSVYVSFKLVKDAEKFVSREKVFFKRRNLFRMACKAKESRPLIKSEEKGDIPKVENQPENLPQTSGTSEVKIEKNQEKNVASSSRGRKRKGESKVEDELQRKIVKTESTK